MLRLSPLLLVCVCPTSDLRPPFYSRRLCQIVPGSRTRRPHSPACPRCQEKNMEWRQRAVGPAAMLHASRFREHASGNRTSRRADKLKLEGSTESPESLGRRHGCERLLAREWSERIQFLHSLKLNIAADCTFGGAYHYSMELPACSLQDDLGSKDSCSALSNVYVTMVLGVSKRSGSGILPQPPRRDSLLWTSVFLGTCHSTK